MAFGFTREAGTGRGYVNVDNPDFAPGQRLSRRQYDKFVFSLGRHQPGLRTSIEAIRDTERQLEALRASLASREASLEARERLADERARELDLERALFRAGRTGAGQRRYHAALESFVRSERARGRTVNKRQAAKDPRFRAAMEDLKGKPNKRRNPNVADDNRYRRIKALQTLGGDTFFRDQYQSIYGGDGHGLRVRRNTSRILHGRAR